MSLPAVLPLRGRGRAAHTSIFQGYLATLPLVGARNSEGPMPNPPTYPPDKPRAIAQQLFQCADDNWLQIMDPTRQFDYATMPTMWDVMAEADRSEEHTSALQSLMRISYAAFCLKKKTTE